MLESETEYKIVNLGLCADFVKLFSTEPFKENINEGNIVLLGYEYGEHNKIDNLDQKFIMIGLDANIDMNKPPY